MDEQVYVRSDCDRMFEQISQYERGLLDAPTNAIWFKDTLRSLLSALVRECQTLKFGSNESKPWFLGWACRNLLELKIITKYSLLKGSNARAFADDALIDGFDLFTAIQAYVSLLAPNTEKPDFTPIITGIQSAKVHFGIDRKHYLGVGTMAKDVGLAEEYHRMNKITSKLVHQTSFSVLINSAHFEALNHIFLVHGVESAVEAFSEIKDYVAQNGVEPLP